MISTVDQQAIESIRESLDVPGGDVDVKVTVPRSVAEKLLEVLVAERLEGALVLRAKQEFRPNEAAAVLGISRPHVSRLIAAGRLDARKVGTHWRIPATSLSAFLDDEKAERRRQIEKLADLQNELGMDD